MAVVLTVALFSANLNAATHYVWQDSPSPGPPYDSWATAATNIQDAVDAAVDGDTVLATNGVYSTGGRAVVGTMTNRVVVDRAITLLSVNGPVVTVIEGAEAPGGGVGDGAIRCVYVGANAMLSGFSVTNGHTRSFPGADWRTEQSGGGLWCESSCVVTNCLLIGNSAWGEGGGAYGGHLIDCTLAGNEAYHGGGVYVGTLHNCTLTRNWADSFGGGVYSSTLYNCTVTTNWARHDGGGAFRGTLYGCTLAGNEAFHGAGASEGALHNCILTGNSARGIWASGGGAYYSTLHNCTLTDNWAEGNGGGADRCTFYNCTLTNNGTFYAGGAADGSMLFNCILTGNSAQYHGGGVRDGHLYNCILAGNSAAHGGGAYHSMLYNCTLTGNGAFYSGGGANGGTLFNCTLTGNSAEYSAGGVIGFPSFYPCTLYNNTAPRASNYSDCDLNYSCTTPLPPDGLGNITNEPAFVNEVAGNFRLAPGSPCIDTGSDFDLGGGTNLSDIVTNDLDGKPRPIDGDGDGVARYDMGAYEYGVALEIARAETANKVTLSWIASPGEVYVLEQTLSLTPPSWANSPGGSTNPITVEVMEGQKYFRLREGP